MTKVDRALETQIIDWLQWGEFPNHRENLPALALELINKRKKEHKIFLEALRYIANSTPSPSQKFEIENKNMAISALIETGYPPKSQEKK